MRLDGSVLSAPSRTRLVSPVTGSASSGLAREVFLVTAAILAYFGIRNLTVGSPQEAFANADRIVEFERRLGIAWEHGIQSSVVGSDALVTLANWVYIWGHWPVLLSTAVVLYLYRRDQYYLLRNAMFVSGSIGFLFFAIVPVAPPRLVGLGLVDTVTDQSDAYRALQPPGLTNQYAALPSLHFGWNLVVGVVLLTMTAHVLVRVFAVLSPFAMGFAVVATANHFVVDVLAGALVVTVGLLGAFAIEERRTATLGPSGSEACLENPRRVQSPVRGRAPRREPHLGSARGRGARSRARRS